MPNPYRPAATLAALAALNLQTPAFADDVPTLEPVLIESDRHDLVGAADTASEGVVGADQLVHRPLLRPAEALEAVPGLIVTQHSGDGKANQYFLRGFNLDHGSDFSTHVMGMPVNMVSHGHGQGYMDLNFLIPELIGTLRYRKGVYAAEDGDFATTGSARIDYARSLPAPFADVSVGGNGYRRALAAGSHEREGLTWLAAVEFTRNDGPWVQPEQLQKENAVLRLSSGTASNGFSLTAMVYQARWYATEHVPERAIDSGEIDRYGALLPSDGGHTHRHSLSGEWAREQAGGELRASAYAIDYDLNLFSAPSGFIKGPQGDQHEQADRRRVFGGELVRTWRPADSASEWSAGLQLRHDRIGSVGLYDTVARARTHTVREDRIRQTGVGLFGELRTQWQPWLRSVLALRHDDMRAEVDPLAGTFNAGNGGRVRDRQTSPKLSLAFGPFGPSGRTEYYASWGRGFHSNDARGATARTNPQDGTPADAVPLLVRAEGSEIGLRTTPLPGWNTSLAVWQMDLASELVFVGDEGVTEPKGASRRHGVEWSNHLMPLPGLSIDADVAASHARFTAPDPGNGGRHVPNAIPLTASLALTLDRGGPWSGGLRLRYIGAYALEETGRERSEAFWMVNARAGYRIDRSLRLTVDVLNLFGSRAHDITYWGGACSRADGAGCNGGDGIDGRLVHPLEPRTVRVALRMGF
ncbi:TonB-dependent receptor [Methyloversatilis universalis]|uniref:TonB-dependent receptor n=1 Tax=Methyloversatilis universalis TaxID=378211 RepID=UPI00036340A7|nr:TonB-dependent receptor [Methyloversatilis universalis]